jgi:hypothetical protein
MIKSCVLVLRHKVWVDTIHARRGIRDSGVDGIIEPASDNITIYMMDLRKVINRIFGDDPTACFLSDG